MQSQRKKLYNHLQGLGGSKLRDFLYTAMKEIMTDELIYNFTWLGDASTIALGKTKLINVVYYAAKKCPFFRGPVDKNEMKTHMLQVLRAIKQRYKKKWNKTKILDPLDHHQLNDESASDAQSLSRRGHQ